MQHKSILALILLACVAFSCMDDDALWQVNKPEKPQTAGVFIVNEGNFMYDNASLSFYQPDSMQVKHNVFYNANALPLGDVAQSMTIHDSLAYVVMNNSGKVYALHTKDFSYAGKITGLTSPRYMHFVSDTKAYISDMYAKAITIINPQSMKVTGSIDVNNHHPEFYQHSTEEMVQYGKMVFISCWSYDNTILVVDSQQDQVVDSIQVPRQPNSMVKDRYGHIWVLTDGGHQGNPYAHERPALVRIDGTTQQVEQIFRFNKEDSPSELTINGSRDTLYFINRAIYRHPVQASAPPGQFIASPYETTNGGFYGLGVDPENSQVYVADAIDLVQKGVVYRYSPRASPLDTFRVGIIPGEFVFMQP